jgi:hypothetical protein
VEKPVSLAPVRIAGAYYSLTYSEQLGYVRLEKNGELFYAIHGKLAQEYIEKIDHNPYDAIVELKKRKESKVRR